jgi:hypothetical protein
MRGLASMSWLLVQLACAAATLLHLGFVFWHGYIQPSQTNTVVKESNLKDIDFPVVLKICAAPGFNDSALKEAGYDDAGYYFGGWSRYNSSILGWAGHTNTSGVQGGVAEVLARVRSHAREDVITKIIIKTSNNEEMYVNVTNLKAALRRVNFPDNCYTLDLTNITEVKEKGIQVIQIHDNRGHEQYVEFFFEGSSLTTDRIIKAHRLYSSGDKIEIKEQLKQNEFVVEISQNVLVENDPAQNCKNYPNSEFATYRDCDDQWMKNQVATLTPG